MRLAAIVVSLGGVGALACDPPPPKKGPPGPAEQSAMALDSLFVAYKQNVKLTNEHDLRSAIDQLFQQLDNPSAYNAPRFSSQMQKVSALLAHETKL